MIVALTFRKNQGFPRNCANRKVFLTMAGVCGKEICGAETICRIGDHFDRALRYFSGCSPDPQNRVPLGRGGWTRGLKGETSPRLAIQKHKGVTQVRVDVLIPTSYIQYLCRENSFSPQTREFPPPCSYRLEGPDLQKVREAPYRPLPP